MWYSNVVSNIVKLNNTELKGPCKASLENEIVKIDENGRIELKGPCQEKEDEKLQQNEQFLTEENGTIMKTVRQEGRTNINETTGRKESIKEENKEGRLIQRRKIQLGLEKENENNRKSQEKEVGRKKTSNAQLKKKENEKEENTDMKKEKVKRGRKRHTEKGILEGEQSIKKFLVKKRKKLSRKPQKGKDRKLMRRRKLYLDRKKLQVKELKPCYTMTQIGGKGSKKEER